MKETKQFYCTFDEGREVLSVLEMTSDTLLRISNDDRVSELERQSATKRFKLQRAFMQRLQDG